MKNNLLCFILFLGSPAQGYIQNFRGVNYDGEKRISLQIDVNCKELKRIKSEANQRYNEAHEELHLAEVDKDLNRDIFLVAFTRDSNVVARLLGRGGKIGRINPDFKFRSDLMYLSFFEDIVLARDRILKESIKVPSIAQAEDNYAKAVLLYAETVSKFEEVQSRFFDALENYKKNCQPSQNISKTHRG